MSDGKLDQRSLAIFRIALGLVLFSQSILLSRDFDAFYQAGGVVSPPAWGHPLLAVLIFGAIPLFAIALAIGFVTRLSTLLSFVSLLTVHTANQDILQGGDVLLRLLLFWSLFLPLGHVWSVDARYLKVAPVTLPWTTRMADWALTLQICSVYWFAALLKSDPLWTQSGNALFYALNIEHFTTPLGLYLRQFPGLLRVFTFGTLCLEFAGPLLLFSPFRRDACRLAAVALFVSFHLLGMQALLRIGLFPWVCATAWLVFIPGPFWDWWQPRVSASSQGKKKQAKRESLRKTEPAKSSRARPFLDLACCVFIAISFLDGLAWNVASLAGARAMVWINQNDSFGNFLGLRQRWNMYAPHPRTEHGWLVVPADLADGTEIDLFTGQPVSWEKPRDLATYFGDDLWRRYLSNLFDDRDPAALQGYADYLVRRWNQSHGENQRVEVVTIVFMKQITQPDLTVTPPEKETLYFKAY